VNGNNQWEWEGNGNKTRLNFGLGMGINHREWEGMGLKKIFPLISSRYIVQGHSSWYQSKARSGLQRNQILSDKQFERHFLTNLRIA